ncbi:hypothetical protein [Sorangium cellulosum]|nr:hypothetical protein [Sorangium cellulosum]
MTAAQEAGVDWNFLYLYVLAGFPDHAGGLGQALLKLRDQYAPSVSMGWHASNFRVGQYPEVVSGFYSSMGDWDVLVGENFHLSTDESTWWEPLDEELVSANLSWLQTVTSSAKVPMIAWQQPIGTTDYHFFDGNRTLLERFAAAGLGGVMFELLGSGDPDDFRATGELGAVPPSQSTAGGTAAELRARQSAYSESQLAWPAGSPCAQGGGSSNGGTTGNGGPTGSSGSMGSSGPATGNPGSPGVGAPAGGVENGRIVGVGCQMQAGAGGTSGMLAIGLGALAAGLLRKRRAPRG